MQNEDPDAATTFKGRVLIEYSLINDEHPVMKMRDIEQTPEYLARLANMKQKNYFIQAEIGSAICLPDSSNYTLKIKIGELEWSTGKPIQGKDQGMKNYCRWNTRISKPFTNVHQGLYSFPKVFIYLMDGTVPICYWKDECTNYTDPNAKQQWVPFECDLAVGKCTKPHMAGIFQFRLYLQDAHEEGKHFIPENYPAWSKPPAKRQNAFKIRCYLYQAENLPPCDATGASDPYIECWTPNNETVKTLHVEQTNNPLYYETKEYLSEFTNIDEAPPIILNFYDTDAGIFDSEDDYMGRAIIFLNDIDDLSSDDRIPKPQWFDVKYSMNSPHDDHGPEVLASFAVVDYDYDFAVEAKDIMLANQVMIPESQGRPA